MRKLLALCIVLGLVLAGCTKPEDITQTAKSKEFSKNVSQLMEKKDIKAIAGLARPETWRADNTKDPYHVTKDEWIKKVESELNGKEVTNVTVEFKKPPKVFEENVDAIIKLHYTLSQGSLFQTKTIGFYVNKEKDKYWITAMEDFWVTQL